MKREQASYRRRSRNYRRTARQLLDVLSGAVMVALILMGCFYGVATLAQWMMENVK